MGHVGGAQTHLLARPEHLALMRISRRRGTP